MVDKEGALKKTHDFLLELKKMGVTVQAAYLFGSYAEDKQHEWSDIDLALFSDQFTGFGFDDKKDMAHINIRKEFVDIEVKTFPIQVIDNPDPFVKQIFSKGIKLISK